jgi:hypothetical protein
LSDNEAGDTGGFLAFINYAAAYVKFQLSDQSSRHIVWATCAISFAAGALRRKILP